MFNWWIHNSLSPLENEMDTGNEQNITESDKNFNNNNSSIHLDRRFEECHGTLEMQYVRYIHSRLSFHFHISFPFGFSVGKKNEAHVYLVSNVKCRSAFIASHEIELKTARLHHSILSLNVNPFFFSLDLFLRFSSLSSLVYFTVKFRCNWSIVLYIFHKQTRFYIFLSFSHSMNAIEYKTNSICGVMHFKIILKFCFFHFLSWIIVSLQ